MKSITSFLRRHWLLAVILVAVAIVLNIYTAFAQEPIPVPVSGFEPLLLLPLLVGILAHWLKSYVRGQTGGLWLYLSTGWSNTLATFLGAVGVFIGMYNVSPQSYTPVTFTVVFNVFMIGFTADSIAGGTSWKTETPTATAKPS